VSRLVFTADFLLAKDYLLIFVKEIFHCEINDQVRCRHSPE